MKIWKHEWIGEDNELWGVMSTASIVDVDKLKEL